MSPISKPQLLLYLQLSQIESVYQVAQNPDIMALILSELEPIIETALELVKVVPSNVFVDPFLKPSSL